MVQPGDREFARSRLEDLCCREAVRYDHRYMKWQWLWRPCVAVGALTLAAEACTAKDDVSCAFAGDGVCDEPGNCALGTDEDDCAAACSSGQPRHRFAAACAFRAPRVQPPDDGVPSAGHVHLTGHRDGTIDVPSGEDPARIVARNYRLFVPRHYDPRRSTPLVIMMGGHRVPHDDLADYTELGRTADHDGYIVVWADQEWRTKGEQRWAWWTDWDWANKAADNPDLAFLRKLVARVESEYTIDESRVFLAGHSRGASMSIIGALELSDIVAGGWVQSGFTEFNYLDLRLKTAPARKVPFVFMHGIADKDVPITGNVAQFKATDAVVARLKELGWKEDTDFIYYRLGDVAHRWQPWLNQWSWAFLGGRPLKKGAP